MTLQFQDRWFDQIADSTFATPLARERLLRVGSGTLRENLLDHGYLEWWLDQPPSPGHYYFLNEGARIFQNNRVEQVNTWTEFTAQQKRDSITAEIEAQIVEGTARQLVEDPTLHRSIESTSAGASERKSDLQDEPDVNLDAFDPMITPTPVSGAGFIEARMTMFVDRVEPWVGAPDNDLALRVVLEILHDGDPAAGASARAQMYNHLGVDQGILPFVESVSDPKIWETQSQEGRYWSDENQAAQMRLFWNNGSLPVTETLMVDGLGDRRSSVVRASI